MSIQLCNNIINPINTNNLYFFKDPDFKKNHRKSTPISEYSKLHSDILNASNIENPNEYIFKVKNILMSCKQLQSEINNGYENSISEQDMQHIDKISKELIIYLKNLNNDQIKNFNEDDVNSLFLTIAGIRSGCVINFKMAQCILNSKYKLFGNINGITDKDILNNNTLCYVFNVPKTLNVINSNTDFFPKINDINEFIEYIKEKNIKMLNYILGKKVNKKDFYTDHVRTGLLLGFPKPIVIYFASLHHALDNFYDVSKNYEIYESENIELGKLLKQNDIKGYFKLYKEYEKIAKTRNLVKRNKILANRFSTILDDIIPEEAFDLLSGYEKEMLPGTIYLVYREMQVSENFKKLINFVFEYTAFNQQFSKIQNPN